MHHLVFEASFLIHFISHILISLFLIRFFSHTVVHLLITSAIHQCVSIFRSRLKGTVQKSFLIPTRLPPLTLKMISDFLCSSVFCWVSVVNFLFVTVQYGTVLQTKLLRVSLLCILYCVVSAGQNVSTRSASASLASTRVSLSMWYCAHKQSWLLRSSLPIFPSNRIDSIRADNFLEKNKKTIRSVLCCIALHSCAQSWSTHILAVLTKWTACWLGLRLSFVCFC